MVLVFGVQVLGWVSGSIQNERQSHQLVLFLDLRAHWIDKVITCNTKRGQQTSTGSIQSRHQSSFAREQYLTKSVFGLEVWQVVSHRHELLVGFVVLVLVGDGVNGWLEVLSDVLVGAGQFLQL